jgi:glycosyltransferase involved in cell wall biosynthesis
VTDVLHVLPHRGGGAETYLDLLERLPDVRHERATLSSSQSPAAALVSIPLNWPALARGARRSAVVHAHGDVAATLALPLLRARPSVWTTHGLHALSRASGAGGWAIRAGVRAAVSATAATICCSHAERDELAATVEPALHDRLRVVPNGVDLPTGDPGARQALDLSPESVVALYLGRLEARKDPFTAVRAATLAADEDPRVLLLVAGDGPLAAAVWAERGRGVRVLGFRDDPQRLLSAADVFVLPSRREGLSFAVLEAMAHGLAMVVADEPGNREALGGAGIIVPPGDAEALARALVALAADPGRRMALGAHARERVAREFTVEALLEGVRCAYSLALGSG